MNTDFTNPASEAHQFGVLFVILTEQWSPLSGDFNTLLSDLRSSFIIGPTI